MKLQEVTSYKLKSQSILNESWETLTESQRLYVGRWEKELWPLLEQYTKLCEAELAPAQIQQIFQSAEEVAVASGDNTTRLGKVGKGALAAAKLPIDLAKQIDAKINELGRLAQKAGPVQNMDQKFDQLKKDILAKNSDSKIVQGIEKVSNWAKENPGKASLAVGILTTLAAFAGGPAGGAAAGLIFRATKDLLQGEQLSTAVGKSVKTAALGFVAGKAFEMLGNWMAGFREKAIPFGPSDAGLEQVSWGATKTISSPGMEWTRTTTGFNALVRPEEAEAIRTAMAGIRSGDPTAFDSLMTVAREVGSKDYKAGLDTIVQGAFKAAKDNDSLLQFINAAKDGLQAGSQGAIAATVDNKKESVSMEDKYEQYLQEGPMDALKKAGSSVKNVAGKIGAKAAAVGKELGNKVTVNKLMKQWKTMGEPTDTGSIMNILQGAGLSNDQISQVGQTAKVDLKPAATTAGTTMSGKPKIEPTLGTPSGATKAAAPAASSAAGGKAVVDLKSLADEIKQAGPDVIDAVKALLTSGAAKKPAVKKATPQTGKSTVPQGGGKIAGYQSMSPGAQKKRAARAAPKTATPAAPAATKAPAAKPKYAAQPSAAPAVTKTPAP